MSATTGLLLLGVGVYLALALGLNAGAPWMCFCPRSRCEWQPRRKGWECLDCGGLWELDHARWHQQGRPDIRSAPRLRHRSAWHVERPRRRWRFAAWCVAEGVRMAWREVWR